MLQAIGFERLPIDRMSPSDRNRSDTDPNHMDQLRGPVIETRKQNIKEARHIIDLKSQSTFPANGPEHELEEPETFGKRRLIFRGSGSPNAARIKTGCDPFEDNPRGVKTMLARMGQTISACPGKPAGFFPVLDIGYIRCAECPIPNDRGWH